MCIDPCFVCPSVWIPHACLVPAGARRGHCVPETIIIDGHELPYGPWKFNLGPLPKQQVLRASEPSSHLLYSYSLREGLQAEPRVHCPAGIYVGSEDLNSRPPAFKASTLPTEPSTSLKPFTLRTRLLVAYVVPINN